MAQSQALASMGQPARWQVHIAPFATRDESGAWLPSFALGAHHSLTNPVTGLLGVTAELHASADRADARLLATSRALGLSAGGGWDGVVGPRAMVSFQTALRRGGLFGHGSMMRVDWFPGRDDAYALGLHVPIGQRFAGRTRPRATDVDEPVGRRRSMTSGRLGPDVEVALAEVGRAATMILAYTNLFARDTARVRYGESYGAAARSYQRGLEQAFNVATGNVLMGKPVADRGRRGLLDEVILPYDSLFGQVKEHATSIRPLTGTAHASFVEWLRDSTRLTPAAQTAAAIVHGRWMELVEAVHSNLLGQWGDSRLVWLPLQLALTEEEYDEQAEVDALLERAVGHRFTDGNALTYLRSSDLPLEIARSIFAARDYHVLWTHDFTGQRDDTKDVDEVAYTMVADAYLPALTRAVQRYDTTGVMPAYMILIDEFFYAKRNGRLWMSMLENPLEADMDLPGDRVEWESHLRARQAELRDAVAASKRLPLGAARVHVNVVNPADFSFRSPRIIPPWPFVPDNIMRDHRKIVFYDLSDADPYRGALMIMGVGIGEHYASATWEDRGYRVRGPAAQFAKRAVREALSRQGLYEAGLPRELQAQSVQRPVDSIKVSTDYVGRALQVHNEVGFGMKQSSIARAMLYNLAPPGSVIIVPDPIWVSETWAAMLAGAAARGARVYIIAPSSENNPNPQGAIAALEHGVMERLLRIRERLAPQLRRTGGELRVGIYTSRAQVTDVAGRIAEVREGLRRAPWIRQVIPFDDATLAVLDRALQRTEADGSDATTIARDEKPRLPMLHQKTQLIARPGAIERLVRQPGWENVLAQAMQVQSRQSAKFADQLGWVTPDIDSTALRSADVLLRGYEQSLSESDRKAFSFYFSVGMQNQDPRGIMMDGEATLLVSGLHAAAGLVDLHYLMARSTWIENRAQLDQLIPLPGGFTQWLARLIRYAI